LVRPFGSEPLWGIFLKPSWGGHLAGLLSNYIVPGSFVLENITTADRVSSMAGNILTVSVDGDAIYVSPGTGEGGKVAVEQNNNVLMNGVSHRMLGVITHATIQRSNESCIPQDAWGDHSRHNSWRGNSWTR
jgi:hypothetical protein